MFELVRRGCREGWPFFDKIVIMEESTLELKLVDLLILNRSGHIIEATESNYGNHRSITIDFHVPD